MRVCRERKVLDMLGMPRRAGELLVGQDKVLPALKGAEKFAVFVTDDCSANVSRHIETAVQRGTAEIFLLEGTGRRRYFYWKAQAAASSARASG